MHTTVGIPCGTEVSLDKSALLIVLHGCPQTISVTAKRALSAPSVWLAQPQAPAGLLRVTAGYSWLFSNLI